MKDQKTVTNSAAVNVFSAPHAANASFRCRQVVVQNNGAVAARLTLGGSASGAADAPTATTGLRLLAGASLSITEPLPSKIDAIAESGSTTIDVVTD